ncbi:MAG: TonB-dependent receptor [Porphyromonadaceae bacterium]|nr:TonB-dependent receptor [Porphyromonadaceae bacterium]
MAASAKEGGPAGNAAETAPAEEAPSANTEEEEASALEEIVVTATRTPKALKDVPVVTRVIGSDELRKADATNIQDLLTEEIPGLEFGFSMTQETSLSMSGFGGSAVLFLVDGERLAGETMDNVDYNRLSLGDVGRVEIVKGASSALYGANAVGGVVNLISREDTAPWHLDLNSRYSAMGDEWRAGAVLGLSSGNVRSATTYQFSTRRRVNHTDAFDTASSVHNIFGGTTHNIKKRLTWNVAPSLKLVARGGFYYRESDRLNYSDRYHDYSGGLRALWNIREGSDLELSYSYDQYDKSRFEGDRRTHDHDYSNRQHILHALFNRILGKLTLTAGADYMHDYLTTYQFAGNGRHLQHTFDAFVQGDYTPVEWFNAVASLREDYFSASRNNAVTARAAAMFRLAPLSIRLSYSGGFRAPTLKELYMDFDMAGIQMIYGNPDLKPERSHNFNVALERMGNIRDGVLRGSYSLTLSGYYNYYDSRITTEDAPGQGDVEAGARYCNEDGVKVCGVDFNVRYRADMGLGANISYNFLHVGGGTVDSQFSQPRPHSATWRLDYERRLGASYRLLYAALSGRYLGKPESRYPTDGAYSIWKLTLQQSLWRGIAVNFTVDNLFNYRPKIYYWNSAMTTGTTWSIGISIPLDDRL